MKTTKFTDEQVAMALRQAEAGTPVAEICRKLGLSEQSSYRWKKSFGPLGAVTLERSTRWGSLRKLTHSCAACTRERDFSPTSCGSGKAGPERGQNSSKMMSLSPSWVVNTATEP